MDDGRNINNLMGMAGTAERAGNYVEAISYYNRVLEADPGFSEAWLGKGRSAGWQSTLASLRISETIVAFGHAIATAAPEYQMIVSERAADDACKIIAAVYSMAHDQEVQHRSVPGTRDLYVNTSAKLLDSLSEILVWKPNHRDALQSVIGIGTDLLNLGVTDPLKGVVSEMMSNAVRKIADDDPNFVAPSLATRTVADQEASKASSDAVGYVVAFILIIIFAIFSATTRG